METSTNFESPQIPDFSKMDYYTRLGVGQNANDLILKQAFRELSLKFHPDRHPGVQGMDEAFRYLSEAYTTLKDPTQRERYNQRLEYERVSSILKRGVNARNAAQNDSPFRHNPREKKAAPNIHDIKSIAINRAGMGATYYSNYIEDMIAAGCPEAASLIHTDDIKKIITETGLQKAAIGPVYFGAYITEWIECGYDRALIANNPKLLDIIKRESLKRMIIDSTFFAAYQEDWLKSAKINIAGVIRSEEAQTLIKKLLLDKLSIAPTFFRTALEGWVRAGYDKRKIITDPDLVSLVKKKVANLKLLGPSYYEPYRKEMLETGVDIAKI